MHVLGDQKREALVVLTEVFEVATRPLRDDFNMAVNLQFLNLMPSYCPHLKTN